MASSPIVDRSKHMSPIYDYVALRKKSEDPNINAYKVLIINEPETELAKLVENLNDHSFLNAQRFTTVNEFQTKMESKLMKNAIIIV